MVALNFGEGFLRFILKLVDVLESSDITLAAQASQEAKNNKELVSLLLRSPKIRPLLTLPTNFPKGKLCKGDRSKDLREEGNKHYNNKDIKNALSLYNDSLVRCLPGTIDYALCCGNRSAVWFELTEFECCLSDIDAAAEAGYPAEKLYKLHYRKAKCLLNLLDLQAAAEAVEIADKSLSVADLSEIEKKAELLKFRQQYDDARKKASPRTSSSAAARANPTSTYVSTAAGVPTLSRAPNNDYPAFSSVIGVKRNDFYGTHVVAKEEINVGEIIAVEDPFVAVLLPSSMSTHCYGCLKRFKTFYPCRKCTLALYCSQKCEMNSWLSYHRFECDNIALINATRLGHAALRASLIAGLNHSFEHANDFNDRHPRNAADGTICPPEYARVLSLSCRNWNATETLQHSLLAVYLALCTNLSEFAEKEPACGTGNHDELLINVATTTFHLLKIFSRNAFYVNELQFKYDRLFGQLAHYDDDKVPIAIALYPNVSLFNHSCDFSAVRVFHGAKIVIHSFRPVPPGEQIFVRYGRPYGEYTKEERQNWLKIHYSFDCTCEACQYDWPTWNGLEADANVHPLPSCRHTAQWKRGCDQCRSCSKQFSKIKSEVNKLINMFIPPGTADHRIGIAKLARLVAKLHRLAKQPHFLFIDCMDALDSGYSLMGNSLDVSTLH